MPPEGHIRVLPESLANKIAAGEVVERPSSVVKELIENSIDAGANIVRVEVEAGGRKLVRVTDDGGGMTSEDALLSIERHATSKLTKESDLFEVRTMGFRGEALPSIAAVGRMEILTRAVDREEGVRLRIEGGVVQNYEPAGCAPGTVITVRDIFYNVPARKKFLRSKNTELANISDTVARTAIAHRGIHFQLHHDGREVIEAPPAGDLGGRLADLLGSSALASMVPVETAGGSEIEIHGMVGLPELSRSNSSHIYVYVNRRAVRDRMITHAATDAYRGILPKGRYPVLVVFIELDPRDVDVNVHPAKSEVKFRNSNAVHECVRSAVLSAFDRKRFEPAVLSVPSAGDRRIDDTPADHGVSGREDGIRDALSRSVDKSENEADRIPFRERETESPSVRGGALMPVTKPRPWGYFSELNVLGQLRGMYIVCQSSEGLMLIDQHAAHERTAFERLIKEYRHDRVRKQSMLFPENIELGLKEAEEMERFAADFDRLGFEIERFGPKAWKVTAVPAVLSSSDPREIVMDVLDSLGSRRTKAPLQDRLDAIFARMACHAVVRGNRNLSTDEMRALLKSLDEADHPLTCPHGRPICVHISFHELEKMFGRR